MGDLGTTSAFYAARPTLSVDNRENTNLTDGLLTLLVEETNEGLYRCELTFGNWGTADGGVGYLYFDRSLLDFGKKIGIRIGDGDSAATVFEGRIMGIEANYMKRRPPEVAVLAEDRFQDLRMTRRTRTFEDVSDEDVVKDVASQHSLKPDIDIDGPARHKVIAQVNQSDLAFLRERARTIDAEVWVEGDTLHAQARSRRNREDVTLTFGQRLQEFSVLADLAGQCTSLIVSGWNVETKEGIEHEADESTVTSELNGDQSGSSILRTAIGERKEQLVHVLPMTDEEARHMAEAQYRMTCRRFTTGTATAEGDGRIRVGTYVELAGLGSLFNGKYYVVEVRHTFDGVNGYRTYFKGERPGVGQ